MKLEPRRLTRDEAGGSPPTSPSCRPKQLIGAAPTGRRFARPLFLDWSLPPCASPNPKKLSAVPLTTRP
jgi:hypothetical protein